MEAPKLGLKAKQVFCTFPPRNGSRCMRLVFHNDNGGLFTGAPSYMVIVQYSQPPCGAPFYNPVTLIRGTSAMQQCGLWRIPTTRHLFSPSNVVGRAAILEVEGAACGARRLYYGIVLHQ
jgi:hypothetical protein